MSGPTRVTLPSSTSSAGRMRRYSKARVRLPPNSAYMASLRTRSPSKAEPYDTGIGTLAIFTLMPRTSTARWISRSVRSMSSAPRDLVEGHRDDVLVGGHAGRQDLRDARVGDHREAERDGAGGRRVLQVVDLAEGEHEGKHAILVVEHDLARVAGLHAAEGERRAGGEAQGVDGGDRVEAEGHGEGVVAELDALLHELVDDAAAVDVAGEEDEDAAALQLAHDLHGDIVAPGAADDRAEARACARRRAGCPRRAAARRRWGR